MILFRKFRIQSMKVMLVTMFLILMSCGSLFERQIPLSERWIVGVLPASNKSGNLLANQYSETLQNALIDELHTTQRFRLIERAKISAMLSEMKLQQLGVIETSQATELGKLLGVEAGLVTDIQAFKNEKVNSLKIGSVVKIQKEIAQASIHSRLIHVQTGEILGTGDADGNLESGNSINSPAGGSEGGSSQNLVTSLLNQSAKVISQKMTKNVIPKK